MPDNIIASENEQERINALRKYQILDTPPDGAFDNITALIAQLLEVPIAIISLVDTDRIWFKSHHGLNVSEVERSPGLCASVILSNDPYIIPDARLDPRSLANPLVAGKFGLRSYAAVPLQTHDGHSLGTLCCIDFKPRTFSLEQTKILETLAKVVMDQMELRLAARRVDELHQNLQELHEKLREQATHDSLTGLWNRGAIMELFGQTLARSRREQHPLSAILLDIDFFKQINDTHGHPVGDQVLVSVAQRLRETIRESDAIGRIGGEEFLCLLYPCDSAQAEVAAERCRKAISAAPFAIGENLQDRLDVTVSAGLFSTGSQRDISVQDIIKKADDALYRSKQTGRNRVTVGE